MREEDQPRFQGSDTDEFVCVAGIVYDQLDGERMAAHIDELKAVIQMCFEDACSSTGKIKKATAIELMKYANTSA